VYILAYKTNTDLTDARILYAGMKHAAGCTNSEMAAELRRAQYMLVSLESSSHILQRKTAIFAKRGYAQ
jgi:hypothetical protein